MMKKTIRTIIQTGLMVATVAVTPVASTFAIEASPSPTPAATKTPSSNARLSLIISKGDQEIERRLAKLNKLSERISSALKLTASDKATLTKQVTDEIAGLTALKAKLAAETTVAGASADAKQIVTDYRVYALIVPKVALVRVSNDQQLVEQKLTIAIQKLQSKVTAAKDAGNDVAALQAKLDDASAKVQAAVTLSTGVQKKVINLQPSDYNSDHAILVGTRAQLLTARTNNTTALSDIKFVNGGLKQLASQQ